MPDSQLLLPGCEPKPNERLSTFALVELFGHARIVGRLTEQPFGSEVLFRVDVPDLTSSGKTIRTGFTRYFGPKAIYSITPITEEMVRELLPVIDGTPGEARALSSRSYNDGRFDD
jgi:hypothetical protein